jgi:hypothetical protein
MIKQLDLIEWLERAQKAQEAVNKITKAHARKTDPRTSHDAAASVDDQLPHMEGVVYGAICQREEWGATWDEIGLITGMDKASISPRFKPLRERGLIMAKLKADGTEVRRPGHSGRGQTVWIKCRGE